jgi:polyisoprenoid-binding protein YceI
MKKILLALLMCATMFTSAVFAAETFILDPGHTYVLWQINHLGYSTQAGKWYANGTLMIDREKPENDKLNVTIKVADVITGIPELDKHLKGSDFFDVEKYPTATFVSDKVEVNGKEAKVYGKLTLHGVTKPVTLDVKLNKEGNHPISKKYTAGFSGTTRIKRSDFGINAYLPMLGDEVILTIEAEANKKTS